MISENYKKNPRTSVYFQWKISRNGAGTYLIVHHMHACLTRSPSVFASSSWLWVNRGWGLSAQLITAMHCTAHICNRTEWLQDFIALILCYQKKKKLKKKEKMRRKARITMEKKIEMVALQILGDRAGLNTFFSCTTFMLTFVASVTEIHAWKLDNRKPYSDKVLDVLF